MIREYWSGSDITFWCLVDKKRTEYFKKAIYKTIRWGDIVIDAGTGSGIMALFAVKAGAKRVYAIESDSNLWGILEDNFKKSGYSDRIVLIKGDARKATIPEKADVIICEMVATGLIDEIQVSAMNNLINYLKPGGKILIDRIRNFVELVYNSDKFYYHKMRIVRYEYIWHPELKSNIYTKKYMYKEVAFNKKNNRKIDVIIPIKIFKTGRINGIRISNETIFANGARLRNSEAYCIPLILPIKEQKVKKGDKFLLMLSYEMCAGLKNLYYIIKRLKKIDTVY